MAIRPGQKAAGSILVTGDFEQPTRIRIAAGDWTMGRAGNVILLAPGRQARSLVRWLAVTPAEFLLTRGRKQYVRFQLKAPEDITGSYWGVLLFETAPPDAVKGGRVGARTAARLGTVIYASFERGGVLDGKVGDVTARYAAGKVAFQADFANLGTLVTSVRGRFELKDQRSGGIVAKAPLAPVTVIPGITREIAAEWRGKLPPGDYVPCLYVDYGREQTRQGSLLKVTG